MFKELIKYLPELIILLMSLLYNIARMMSDLGYIKFHHGCYPSMFQIYHCS